MNFAGVIRLNKCRVFGLAFLFIILLVYFVNNDKKVHVDSVNLRKLLIAAIEVAEKGGREVSLVRGQPDINVESKGKTKEGANDPLTNADKHSHCVMYYGLTQAFPKVKVISEEEKSSKDCDPVPLVELDPRGLDGQLDPGDELVPADDVTIWIDPLDATQEFTENLLNYVTTLVCVAVRGKPVIGVIHKPFATEPKTTWSWLGKVMSDDLKRFKKLDPALPLSFIVSRSHAGDVEKEVKKAFGHESNVIPAGGAGYKVLEVAAGNVTAYIHTTQIKKWDICAGNAIIHAVGGSMTTLKNEQIDYSSGSEIVNKQGLLATMGQNHNLILQKMFSQNL